MSAIQPVLESETTTDFQPKQKIKVYIPDDLPSSRDVLDTLTVDLSEMYGGVTEVPNNSGSWLDDDGERVTDSITILETITTDINESHLRGMAGYVKETLQEDAVLIEVEQVNAAFY